VDSKKNTNISAEEVVIQLRISRFSTRNPLFFEGFATLTTILEKNLRKAATTFSVLDLVRYHLKNRFIAI